MGGAANAGSPKGSNRDERIVASSNATYSFALPPFLVILAASLTLFLTSQGAKSPRIRRWIITTSHSRRSGRSDHAKGDSIGNGQVRYVGAAQQRMQRRRCFAPPLMLSVGRQLIRSGGMFVSCTSHRPEYCLTISNLFASDRLWCKAKPCSASGPARYRTWPVPSVAAVRIISAIDSGVE